MWSIVLLSILSFGGGQSVNLYNIQTPDSMNIYETGSWPFGPSFALALDTTRELIFLGSGTGVLILQPSNTGGFNVISDNIRTNGGDVKVLAYDETHNLLFTGGDNTEFEVWSISNPSNPTRIVAYRDTTPSDYSSAYVKDIALNGDYLFVAFYDGYLSGNNPSHIRIYNISDIANVQPISSISLSAIVSDIDIDGDRLFVQVTTNVYVYDISNVASPTMITSFADYSNGIIVEDTLLYGFSGGMWGGGIQIFNISDLNNPVQIASVSSQIGTINRVKKYGNDIYVCGEWLEVWDVANPTSPTISWGFGLLGSTGIYDFYYYDGNYFTSSGTYGFSVIGFDTLGNTFEASSFRVPGFANDIAFNDGYIYYISLTKGNTTSLYILNSNEFVGRVQVFEGTAFPRMAYSNNHVYVAGDTLLVAVDVSDPESPQVIGSVVLPYTYIRDIKVNGEYAFATLDSGLLVISLNNYQVVAMLSDTSLLYGTKKIYIQGNYLYMASGTKLAVIDISNPLTPILSSVTNFSQAYSSFNSIVVNGNYAYLSTETNQILIVDVSTPSNPLFVNSYSPPDSRGYGLYNLTVSGNYLFGTSGGNYSTLIVFDISNPTSPTIAGYYDNYYSGSILVRFAVSNNVIYLADFTIGVHTLSFTPTGILEAPISKELKVPFRTQLNRLTFSTASSRYLEIKIYDVSGKLVMDEGRVFQAGKHDVEIRELRNGIYYYTVGDEKIQERGKIIVVK